MDEMLPDYIRAVITDYNFQSLMTVWTILSLINNETHSFIQIERIRTSSNPDTTNSNGSKTLLTRHSLHAVSVEVPNKQLSRPSIEISRIVSRVPDHAFGRASFGDMKTLF